MLSLSSGEVVETVSIDSGYQYLRAEVAGRVRAVSVDLALHPPAAVGDRIVVNTAACDLQLGSGGYDILHVNLTAGLDRKGVADAHVMKLNYSSLQHAVKPVEELDQGGSISDRPVAICALHGQLAPLVWAYAQRKDKAKLGLIQSYGGALSGGMSKTVKQLQQAQILADLITAGHCYGGDYEAISTAGALSFGFNNLGWDAAVIAPGPGILGSGSRFGHGAMAVMDAAHTATALGCSSVIAPRASSGDQRIRHRGLSHHTATVLELLLCEVTVAWPQEIDLPQADLALMRHGWLQGRADLNGYLAAGLPAKTMGRSAQEDALFFQSALASGSVLAGF